MDKVVDKEVKMEAKRATGKEKITRAVAKTMVEKRKEFVMNFATPESVHEEIIALSVIQWQILGGIRVAL